MNSKHWLFIPLVLMGACWGMTIPLTKLAVSTGYNAIGLVFWQVLITGVVSLVMVLPRLRFYRITKQRIFLFAAIAALGSLLPGLVSLTAARHLPAGVMAITIALVPIFIMPIAIFSGQETFSGKRVLGVLLGAVAIVLLVGPQTSLPDQTKAIFVLLALLSPLCYALEDNYIAHFGLDGLNAIEALLGASIFSIFALGAYLMMSGDFIPLWENGWDIADKSVIGAGFLHGIAYAGYIWMIGKAGPVFAGLVAYLVTGFGVIWSMLLLGETYSVWIWAAFALMFFGLFLVRPRNDTP